MSVTRKEMLEFKRIVCIWLRKQGIDVTKLSIESHTQMNGYVVCWNNYSNEYVIYNRDEWEMYIAFNGYEKIRKADLSILRMR